MTKILTALIVLENCNLDDTVTFSTTAVNQVEADSGNKISVVAGDQLSVEDCLYSMLLVSCNQAANALAEHTAGSISAFVDMMNEKLAELGCQESHFENPSGLNGDNQYVSAYDMALIAQAAYDNETLVEISSATTHRIAPTTQNPDGFTIRGSTGSA
ncbi:MAG: D-alanyl-D-alanine carboxypeptidase family protein [Clostridium sp.]